MAVVGKVQNNLLKVVVGKVQNRGEKERVEKKSHSARPWGLGLKSVTYHVLGESPQLQATEVV